MIALAVLAVAAVFGGLIVAWSGVISVSAAAGHSPPVAWFLHFAMRHSVKTHSVGITPPDDLGSPARAYAGLGHYESACAPCHGAPGRTPTAVIRKELPEPPYLSAEIKSWTPPQLFWIVKNGVKMTAMPGWPAQARDDEVWDMVAGLLKMADMTPEAFADFTAGDTTAPPEELKEDGREIAATGGIGPKLAACGRCHGLDGRGGGDGAFPRLAGQRADYLRNQLAAFALGTRPSGIMEAAVSGLSQEQRERLVRYFASQAAPETKTDSRGGDAAHGARIAAGGIPALGVPACAGCHDPARPFQAYPILQGQSPHYLARQLRLWRSGIRGGSALARVMTANAQHLTDQDIADLAAYYGTSERVVSSAP